ncbi:MAG: hypothetical protein A2136_08385 [Chloroflexi bacterium RBG_16_54_11]|nr:MAG: hypothetical protein A2136_08385 [Chloroflexi bacterium RBG_16_54_11]
MKPKMLKRKINGIPYYLWNPYAPMGVFTQLLGFGPTVTVRGEGNEVINPRGKRYFNGYSGMWSFALGFGREEIIDAINRQMHELPSGSLWGLSHPRAIELAAKLIELTGGSYGRVYLGANGSEVVEGAIKISRQYHRLSPDPVDHGRYKILSLKGSYHGYGYGASTAMWLPEIEENYGPMLPGMVNVDPPYCYRCQFGCEKIQYPGCGLACVQAVEQVILRESPDTMAAFLLDPIPGDLGVIVPPDEYYQKVGEICRKYGLLLIDDEVTTGFGRAGKLFLSEEWNPKPDILLLGKIITGGYLPLSALLATDQVFERFLGNGGILYFGSTHSGHPLSCAAALAAIDIMLREGLPKNAAIMGKRIKEGLTHLKDHHPIIGDVRGKGLMLNVELVKDRGTKEPISENMKTLFSLDMICRGLLASMNGIYLFPPLNIDTVTADWMVDVIDKTLVNHSLAQLLRILRIGKELALSRLMS